MSAGHSTDSVWDWSYFVGGSSSSSDEDGGVMLPVRRSDLDPPSVDATAEEEETPGVSNGSYNPRRRRPSSSTADESRLLYQRNRPPVRRDQTSGTSVITPVRCLAVLFVIATYATVYLPYPQDYLEESGDDAATTRLPRYPMMNASRSSSTRPGQQQQMAFARGDPTSPITFRRTAHEFYQQDAIQEQVWGILPWYANVGLLVVLAVWVLVAVVCQQRQRRQRASNGVSRLLDEYD